jgi:hypothetical protein
MNPRRRDEDVQIDTGGIDELMAGVGSRLHGEPEPTSPAGVPSRRRGGTLRPTQSKFTILLNAEDALTFDELALQMRRLAGRRVDKSEIVRALLQLAHQRPDVAQLVIDQLQGPGDL